MENTINILHLEDNRSDSLLVQALLKSPDVKFEYHFADNEENFISILQNQKIDLILSDYHLPDYTGTEALLFARENFPDIPFVFLSGTMGEDVAIKSLLNGATDYVLKSNMERLVPAVQRAFREAVEKKEKRKAESERIESEKAYRLLFESNPQPMWVLEVSTLRFLAVNESAILKFGYSRKEFLTLRITDILLPEDIEDFMRFDAENQQTLREAKILRHRLKDGSVRLVEGISNRIDFEGKKARLVMITDITERIQAEKDLIRSEENFHTSIAESPLGIRIVTVEGKTIYANKAFLDIYQFSSLDEFTHTPAKKRYSPESYIRHLERKALRQSGLDVLEYELTIIRKDGTIRYLKVSRKEVLWNGVKHFQVIKFDITATKTLLQDLNTAKEKAEESDRLKTAFLNNISHEIRTPFNGLLGFLDLIQDSTTSPEERDEFISIINRSADRLMNTINDIVEISQIQTDQTPLTLSETKITKLANDLYEHYHPEVLKKGLKFIINNTLLETFDTVSTDNSKLNAILSHLINNAIKFTKSGSIELNIHPIDNRLEFLIKDTGVGIPENRQQSIFERFIQADISNTRPFEGAGLGLSISKSYVEMLGGKIWVESEVDKGSTFYFTIPFITTQNAIVSTETSDASNVKEDTPKKEKVLIVEDDEMSEMLLSVLLGNYFDERLYARTGIEAIEVSRNNPDMDLILMDIKMPGMDGYEATRQIRKFNSDVIIIAQTAHALAGDRERALAAGCNEYISKPYNKTSLMKVINKTLKI
jgi:PAS domain S-box-containing protein